MSFYLVGHFVPYYEGADSYFYGVNAKNIADGQTEIKNSLLETKWQSNFAGGSGFSRTIHDTAVPAAGIGFSYLGAAVYSAFGEFGLFYLTPIAGICLLVAVERTTSKLFDRRVGLISLLFVSASFYVVFRAKFLQNDIPFAAVFILGTYFLIQFLQNKKNTYVLLASACFAFTPFLRANGIIFFPAEIIIIAGYFGINQLRHKKPLNILSILKTTALILVPWMLFLMFWFSFNDYYFGDPLTNYYNVGTKTQGTVTSLFSNSYFAENLNVFSRFLLPHPLSLLHNFETQDASNAIGSCSFCPVVYDTANKIMPLYLYLGGIISLVFLSAITFLSIKQKRNYIVMIVFFILIVSVLWFYSSQRGQEDPFSNQGGKYMIPAIILSSVMYAYFVNMVISKNNFRKNKSAKKIGKILFFGFVVVFFLVGIAMSAPGRTALGLTESAENLLDLSDPIQLANRYPIKTDHIPEESVILSYRVKALEYDSIPFTVPVRGTILDSSVNQLKDLSNNSNYHLFALKEDLRKREIQVYNDLLLNHNMTLKNYSEQFCTITFDNGPSDNECLKNLKLD